MDEPGDGSSVELESLFVRERNVLLVRGDFGALFMDHYLHLGQWGLALDAFADTALKKALAAVALHAATRPPQDTVAWTIHFEEPLWNVFVVAENASGRVTGQAFGDGVRPMQRNLLYAETRDRAGRPRQSVVEFFGTDVSGAVEAYYVQSEQRAVRLFGGEDDRFALLLAQPQADLDWLRGLTPDAVWDIASAEALGPLEKRACRLECGCTHERMLQVLLPVMATDAGELFGGEEKLAMRCPRCGARFVISREQVEAYGRARVEGR